MISTVAALAFFGASALAQSSSASASAAVTVAASTTVAAASSNTVASVGANTSGPAELAGSACLPSSWTGPATDVPCYSMEVLNEACFYGPSILATATALPSTSASPADQQFCYCNEAQGVGYMYFEFMAGCSTCFRDHGSAGGPGAYSPDFISSLSSSYCAVATPTLAFGKFLTSLAGNSMVATRDLATSTILGTSQTAVSLYFTTVPIGGLATNGTTNGTALSTTAAFNSTTSSAAPSTTAFTSTTQISSSTTSATTSSTSNGAAGPVQLSGFLGAVILGAVALL